MNKAPLPQAIIFDLDGVISDTQRLHSESEVEALAQLGITCSAPQLALRYSGVPDRVMFAEILSAHGAPLRHVRELEEAKWRLLRAKISQGIPLMPHIGSVVSSLLKAGYRLAVASGAPTTFIRQVLSDPLISEAFEVAVSSDEVARGKPEPDVFLEAARRLNVLPCNCLVIEDGISGMQGARTAGMRCIGLVREVSGEWPADRLVTSLDQISVETITALFGLASA